MNGKPKPANSTWRHTKIELPVPSPSKLELPASLLPIAALDLEVQKQGHIRHMGAVRDDRSFDRKPTTRRDLAASLQGLDDFCRDARFLLGHNLIHHDLPHLRAIQRNLCLLRKPVIDTLCLSPLAFPRNPYHHLVKGYKLVRDSLNDPVRDAQLALCLFIEQYRELRIQAMQNPDLVRFYQYCFATHGQETPTRDYRGLAMVCGTLVESPYQSDSEAWAGLIRLGQGKACPTQLRRVADTCWPAGETRGALPYAVAWLQVAGGNSILPPWVWHQFPELVYILEQWRETPCGRADCSYCRDNHDPLLHLQRFFQYSDFRMTDDGQPLQRELVLKGLQGRSLLGILPTSGGKSVCFQVPALARYQRRGLLTVVISPLQALMKDQVDSLEAKTDTPAVAAVHGLLTPPERGAALEKIRLGDIGLLYLSPEQLRNRSVTRVLRQREIGCWVFDEAHCISKWGSDFRPDYLYCARFIREIAGNQKSMPPVACFTATAKQDVIEDIRQHFREQLDCELELHRAGVERDNLHFEVHLVTQAAKNGRLAELIRERLPDHDSCIVYCATRRATEECAEFLTHVGLPTSHFHGGLEAPLKKEIMNRFMQDEVRIICATNAFGMGVDKENVRLVLHAHVPGSLENYLQEAGRAGRDGEPAECLLLFDEQDVKTQFRLGALSEVHQRDIQQILRGIRSKEKYPGMAVTLTSGELLRADAVDTSFDLDDAQADMKVKTAMAWLERGGFLERNQNSTQVFQGKPLFATLEEAKAKLNRQQLSPFRRQQWELLLSVLINAEPDEGLNADYLAEQLGRLSPDGAKGTLQTCEVMAILNQMAQAGLVSDGLRMTAFLRPKGRNHARGMYAQLCRLERCMLTELYEEHPEAEIGVAYPLNLRLLNQRMLDQGLEYSNPQSLRHMLRSLATDGKGLAGNTGSIEFRYEFKDHYQLQLGRPWKSIWTIVNRRCALSEKILDVLYQALIPEDRSAQREVLVEFSLQNLLEAIRGIDTPQDKEMAAVERGLLYLHEQNVIILQQGLAVFRQSMTLKLNPEARPRRYNQGDYEPLARHYKARVIQVHVMNEYGMLGLESMKRALTLVRDYFAQDNTAFLRRHFRERRELLQLATSQQSLTQIVDALGNPQQRAIVTAPPNENILVLAGPGAGKTRVVVHRCAYLTRVQRVRPFSILALCYNHGSAVTLRRRLKALLGSEAYTVMVYTFHGLALRLLGHSFGPDWKQDRKAADFDRLIADATALLQGKKTLLGMSSDQQRERLLSGIQHILVDEYQDIDARQYDLISALAGRSLAEEEEKLGILAVGDDDQSIYGFRQANVTYIRQFEGDYQAQRHYLVQNYRSTRHIISAGNSLIAHNRDRMKTGQAIRINDARQWALRGGHLGRKDPVSQGRVQIISCPDITTQAVAVVQELQRLRALWPDLEWSDISVLARSGVTHAELAHFRSAAEHTGIPVNLPLPQDQTVSLFRIREFHALLQRIRAAADTHITPPMLRRWIDAGSADTSPWHAALHAVVESWELETEGVELSARAFATFLVDCLRETRREQRHGAGVHVDTVHGSKGREFRVVVILDGNWQIRRERDREEERRLYYVGMTRAKDCLALMRRRDSANPHIALLEGEVYLKRGGETNWTYPLKRYCALGMKDLDLGYAGGFPPGDRIHKVIGELNAGDTVELAISGGFLYRQGQIVARLSQAARQRKDQDWSRFHTVEGRVWALVHRKAEDENEDFRRRNRCAEWEIPLVELVWEDCPGP